MFLFLLGVRVYATSISTYQRAAKDSWCSRFIKYRVEQLFFAVVRGAHGLDTSSERKPHRRGLGGRTASKPILHFLVCQLAEITRWCDVAKATGRFVGERSVTTASTEDARADLQRSSTTWMVPRGDRQLL